jgi:hypothetical protein
MPASLITRLPGASTSYTLPGGGTFTATDRRTEMLRKISQVSKRLRGRYMPNTAFDPNVKGRTDALEAIEKRGIIPIHVMDAAVTLHANVQAYPARRAGPETVTVTDGTYTKGFLGGATATFVNPNADDATLAATGVRDFTATSSLDAAATGAARATIT